MVELNSNLSQSIPQPQAKEFSESSGAIYTDRHDPKKSPPKRAIEVFMQPPSSNSNDQPSRCTQAISAKYNKNDISQDSIPEPLVGQQQETQAQGFIVYGEDQEKKMMAASNASSVPDMMKSEAFGSA